MLYTITGPSKLSSLSNNIVQLTNTIYLCDKNKANFNTENFDIPFIDIKKIQFYSEIVDKEIEKQSFFYTPVDVSDRVRIINKYIKPFSKFPVKQISKKTCVIHIRSDEIFEICPHKNYVQPPFAFYKKIIDDYDNVYDKFLLVTQKDLKNPTISLVEKYSKKVELQTGTLEEDISVILGAESIAIGYGTFIPHLLFFSDNIKNVFHLDYIPFATPGINSIKYKLIKPYINIGEWKNTTEQLELMKNYSSEYIEQI
jgi:hypothetical protein